MKLEAEKIKLLAIKEKYISENALEFFKPLPHQEAAFQLIRDGKKTVLLQGGNRIGKSCGAAAYVISCALGYQPWDKADTVFGKKPIRIRIICSDWEAHAGQVIVPLLKEFSPVGSYETRKNNVGVESFWTFKNGSTIEIMTHKQETQQHEGWSGHIVWMDEPPPKDKYIANKRGLIDFSGVMFMTLTAVSESWILDDIVLSKEPTIGCITEINIRQNPYLRPEDIDAFESTLNPEERIARIQGGWLNLVGRVLKDFNKDVHAIDPFELPSDYPVVAMIDLHLSKPQAIGFYAMDKHERVFVIDEIWENLSPEEISDRIIKLKKRKNWRLNNVYIDPLAKGDQLFMKNRADVQDSFSIIKRHLAPHGMLLQVASKDKDSGVRNLQEMLRGLNKIPSLFFFNNCERHIYEIMRWTYDENGKPRKDLSDHFMENLYRYTLTGTRYIPEDELSKPLNVPQYAYA